MQRKNMVGCLAAAPVLAPALVYLAALATSSWGSRHTAPSNAAVALWCLRTYAGAQSVYRKVDYDGDGVFEYAYPYTRLNTDTDPQTGERIQFLDDGFASASRDDPPNGVTRPRAGYVYVDLLADAAEGRYHDSRGNFVSGCGLCAYPAAYGRTGRWTFVVDAEGTVYAKDTGGAPVTLFPDVEKEGWEVIGG